MPPQHYSDVGSVPAYVDEVVVSGLNRTDDSIVKKQFVGLVKSSNLAELFENVRESKERLAKLGIFTSVFAVVDVGNDKTKKNSYKVTFNVKEKRFVTGGVSVNHCTDGVTKACGNVRLNNIARRAEVADIDVEFGSNQMVSRFATVSKPIENNPYVRWSIGGTEGNWDHNWAKFLRNERSVFSEVQAETILGLHKLRWDAIWREVKVKDQDAPLSVLKESGPALKTGLQHTFESDTRPDLVFPDSGILWKLSHEMASINPGCLTGSISPINDSTVRTDSFEDRALQLKFEGMIQKPIRLFDWLVAELTLSGGLAHSLTKHPIQIADRFFLGGPLELRGFQWRSVSTFEPLLVPSVQTTGENVAKTSGDNAQVYNTIDPDRTAVSPIGADAFWLTGLHLYIPLPYWGAQENSIASHFRIHGFCLAGSTMDKPIQKVLDNLHSSDNNKQIFNNLKQELRGKPRAVVGAGLVIRLAGIVRMELNYCIPVKTQPGDRMKSGFTFGLGMYYM